MMWQNFVQYEGNWIKLLHLGVDMNAP